MDGNLVGSNKASRLLQRSNEILSDILAQGGGGGGELANIETNTLNTANSVNSLDTKATTSNTNTLNTANSVSSLDTKATTTNTNLSTIITQLKPEYDGIGFKVGGGINSNGVNYLAAPVLGRKNNIYTTRSSVVPLLLAGEFVYIPPTAIRIQISSTSANDTSPAGSGARAILVAGFDATYTVVQEVVPLTGQTPASTVASFQGLVGFLVVSAGNMSALTPANTGSIYVSPMGDATTGGVPNNRTRIMGTMLINTGSGFTGYIQAPPGSGLFASELTLSSTSQGQNADLVLEFYTRDVTGGVAGNWTIIARLITNSSSPVVNLHQGGFPSAQLGAGRTDLMLVIRRQGGNTDAILYDAFLTTMITTPLPP